MSEKCGEYSRSTAGKPSDLVHLDTKHYRIFTFLIVRIFLLILLVILIIVGVVWFLRSSDDDIRPNSLTVYPKVGEGALIQFKASDRESVRNVTRKIEDFLKRKIFLYKFI